MTARTITYRTANATVTGTPVKIDRGMVVVELIGTRGTERRTLRQLDLLAVAPTKA